MYLYVVQHPKQHRLQVLEITFNFSVFVSFVMLILFDHIILLRCPLAPSVGFWVQHFVDATYIFNIRPHPSPQASVATKNIFK